MQSDPFEIYREEVTSQFEGKITSKIKKQKNNLYCKQYHLIHAIPQSLKESMKK